MVVYYGLNGFRADTVITLLNLTAYVKIRRKINVVPTIHVIYCEGKKAQIDDWWAIDLRVCPTYIYSLSVPGS
jgi:hypothetical protein